MFERFTDRARKVMALANQEAQRFNHEYIGTEHVLLGLVKEGSGVGATVLKNLEVDIKKLRLEVEKLVKSGPDMVTMGKPPQTPRAKKVIEYAIEEARSLNHNYLGTEHILLGLLRETDGAANHVLTALGLKLEDVRQEVLNLPGPGAVEKKKSEQKPTIIARCKSYLKGKGPVMNRKQMICLWIGIAVMVLMGLFPPYRWGDDSFLFDMEADAIEFAKLFIQWFIVALVTGGLIYTFKNKKPKND